jgi:DNA-binding XRE family transcriptional regulator
VADALKRRRRERGLTNAEAAKLIGIDRSTLGLWESGHHEPAERYHRAVERFLG